MSSRNLFKRKLGKYSIPMTLLDKDPDRVASIVGTTIPVRTEFMFENNNLNYVALSHSFEAVPEGNIIPWYRAVTENGKFVRWERDRN